MTTTPSYAILLTDSFVLDHVAPLAAHTDPTATQWAATFATSGNLRTVIGTRTQLARLRSALDAAIANVDDRTHPPAELRIIR